MKIYRRQGTFFVLNLFLAFILFSNIIFVKKNLDSKLLTLIIVYIFFLFLNEVLSFFVFKSDRILDLIISIFILISLVMIYRINENFAMRQILFIGIGYIFYFLIMIFPFDINKFYKFKWMYFYLSVIFMSLSFLIGISVNGSKNWVSIFGIRFQPSEFGKIFLILYFVCVFQNLKFKRDKILFVCLMILFSAFLFLQKDLGTLVIIFSTVLVMYYIKTSKYKFIFLGGIIGILGFIFSYFKFHHVKVRVISWINPNADPYGYSYQTLQGFFSMGSGGFLGRGLYGGSLEFVPTNYTDYIFVSIVEEFGILTGIIIVILYFVFLIRGFILSFYSTKRQGESFLALSFVILISIQTLLILGGVLNLIPLTGVTLPFLSYGGSSIISSLIMFAIIKKTLGELKLHE